MEIVPEAAVVIEVSIVPYYILAIADSEGGGKFSSVWLSCFLAGRL